MRIRAERTTDEIEGARLGVFIDLCSCRRTTDQVRTLLDKSNNNQFTALHSFSLTVRHVAG